MGPFKKKYSSPEELTRLLKSRGLIITDSGRAEAYLRNIGYYRLSAYMLPFLSIPKTDHQFKPGTTFDNVLDLYRFDKKLRVLLFNEIEKIEIAFREAVANVTAEMTGDIFWITNPIHFKNPNVYAKTFSLIKSEYSKSTEDFIKHFNATYSEPFAPAWMISEIIPFGTTLQLYKNLSDQRIRKQIARQFYLQPQALESWITTLALTRNACCHHSRVWNKVNLIIPADELPKSGGSFVKIRRESIWVTPSRVLLTGISNPTGAYKLVAKMSAGQGTGVTSDWSKTVVITPGMEDDWGDAGLTELYTEKICGALTSQSAYPA